jgi:hypothetical protein
MNADQILTQTFADHESLMPDPEATLDGVHHQLRVRRKRLVTGSLTVGAAAATVSAIVLGTSMLGGGTRTRAVTPAGPGSASAASTASRPETGTFGYLTFGPGWLPVGTHQMLAAHATEGAAHDAQRLVYQARGAIPGQPTTRIALSLGVGERPEARPDSLYGTARSTTVGSRPGTEWAGRNGYFVSFTTPAGQPVTVGITGNRGEPDATAPLRTLGRAVAGSLRFDQRTPLPTSFTLDFVPTGFVISGVSIQQGTSYTLRPAGGAEQPYITVGETAGGYAENLAKGAQSGVTPGNAVNGHRTFVVTSRAYPVLFVENYRPGWSLLVSGSQIRGDLSVLYRIASAVHTS